MKNCKFCGNKAPSNMQGYCQPCYKYFVMERRIVHPLPEYGEITYADNGDAICPFCGKSFRKLGMHLYYGHGMTTDEAFKKAGWDRSAKATNPRYRDRMRQVLQPHCVTENLLKKGSSTRFSKGHSGRTKDMISEMTRKRLSKLSQKGDDQNDSET